MNFSLIRENVGWYKNEQSRSEMILSNCDIALHYEGKWRYMIDKDRASDPDSWHWELHIMSMHCNCTVVGKVHVFWEGHKILRNLHLTFDCMYCSQKLGEDFGKFCGLYFLK